MTIEILTPASREEWLELRKDTIGASEVAAVLGAHPYMTPYELWAKKGGAPWPGLDTIETKAMRRGRLLEDDCIEILREERPDWVVTPNIIGQGGKFYRDINIGISATPDAFVDKGGCDGLGICQVKTVGGFSFHNSWIFDDEAKPPVHVAIQAIQEAHLTGAAWACVAAFVGMDLEPHIMDVPLNNGLMTRMGIEAIDFLRRVRENDPPPVDYARDAEIIMAQYADDDGGEVDLSGNKQVVDLLARRARMVEYERARTGIERDRKAVDAELIHLLGNAARGNLGGGLYIEAKTVRKKECVHKATTYRAVAIKQRK